MFCILVYLTGKSIRDSNIALMEESHSFTKALVYLYILCCWIKS